MSCWENTLQVESGQAQIQEVCVGLNQQQGIASLLRGCLSIAEVKRVHAYMSRSVCERDTFVANLLISLYGKSLALEDARAVFDRMRQRDIVSWNAMMTAYAQHGHSKIVLQLLREMEKEGMKPDKITFICMLRSCANPGALQEGKVIHACIIDRGLEVDHFVGTALVNMYGKCGALEPAHRIFDKMHPSDPVSWNVIIAAYSQQGHGKQALEHFYKMRQHGVKPDKVTVVTVISACASLEALAEGRTIHAYIRDCEFESDVVLGNALITMYGKCGATEEARAVFDKMQHHDVASWNAMISTYAQELDGSDALNVFQTMQQEGVKPDKVTFLSVLPACSSLACLAEIELIHASIVDSGFESDMVVGTALLNTYGKCEAFDLARLLFDKMPQHCLVSWNAMISVYAQGGHGREALTFFHLLLQRGGVPNKVTFIGSLTACASLAVLEEGKLIHAQIVDAGCEADVVVGNALISMYGKCGALEVGRALFDKVQQRSVVTWNAIMAAYAQHGQGNQVLQLFRKMQEEGLKPDKATYLGALSGCANLAALAEGKLVHTCIVGDGLESEVLESALVSMYGKCAAFEEASRFFCRVHQCGISAWNAMIAMYTQQMHAQEALLLFRQMQHIGLTPNQVTFMCVLGACANLADLAEGKKIHACIADCGLLSDTLVATALMNVYGKCGALEDAHRIFNGTYKRDVISWNVMILVYGQQGHGKKSLQLFQGMLEENVRPDDVTFVNLLSSCSHAGLVNEGQDYFVSMSKDHNIMPTLEHFGCMIDLFGRAGQLAEAECFIYKRSLQQHALVWMNLLGVCRLHGDMDRGRRAAEHVLQLEPKDSGTYVLLADMFATDRWDDLEKIRQMMMEKRMSLIKGS